MQGLFQCYSIVASSAIHSSSSARVAPVHLSASQRAAFLCALFLLLKKQAAPPSLKLTATRRCLQECIADQQATTSSLVGASGAFTAEQRARAPGAGAQRPLGQCIQQSRQVAPPRALATHLRHTHS